MLRRILTIWGKELVDTLRDRRTLAMMILVPVLMMPVFTLLPQFMVRGQVKEQESGALVVHVQGAAHGPELIAHLRQGGIEVVEATGDPVTSIRGKSASLVLVIPPEFQAQLQAEKPAQVTLMTDESNFASGVGAGRVRELIGSFSTKLAGERLKSRGLDPALLTPVMVAHQNVATEQQMGGTFLGMFVPLFLVLFAFLGGMYTAIDVTAGEKERGTLEPLLVAPASRTELVIGKLLAVFVTSFGAVILSLASTYLAFQVVPSDLFGTEMSFALPLDKIIWLIVAALPLTLFLNAVEMAICIYARSFKEAQNYITPLQLMLMIPAFVIGFLPGFKSQGWYYIVPALGQMAIFRDILSGDPLNHTHLALTLISASVAAVVAAAVAVNTFKREHVLFRT